MSENQTPYVARSEDLSALHAHWNQAAEGAPKAVRLQAPFGGGRRALVGQFMREAAAQRDEAVFWRVNCLDQENGVQWLVRMYGSLVATLGQDALRKGRAEMILNSQLPSQPKRVQTWYQQFIATLKEAKTDTQTGQVQLRMPQDNPLIGLVEVVSALARRTPICLELQNPQLTNSLALASFVEALLHEARESKSKLMILLFDEAESDITKSLFPMPLLDFYNRNADHIDALELAPWGADETQAFLDSKGLTSDASSLARIGNGRPGFIAELIEILEEEGRLGEDLTEATMASLTPTGVDADELEAPKASSGDDNQRTHATANDAMRVAHLASLLGTAFPSGLVADMGAFERESVDDLIDAMSDLYAEVQFSKEMGSWIYRFNRGCWREGIVELHSDDESKAIAQRVGVFMERYLVPRGYSFISRTAKVYAENGAPARAAVLRGIGLSRDDVNVWGLCYDLSKYFDEIHWPDVLRKTVYMNLLDGLVGGGNVQMAEKVHTEATEWAQNQQDREFTAWLLFNGSRLDFRRQDLYRARDRANDALTLYAALESTQRVAELHNHLAMVELQDGNAQAALDQVNKALEAGKVTTEDGKEAHIPAIIATAEQVRGLVARRSNQLEQAAQHFQRANDIAGQAGLGALALDSGLSFGEALLAGRQTEQARDVLGRVVQIARSLNNPARERGACELLAQAHAARQEFEEAIQVGKRTLQLTQQLKLQQALPVDLYNMGFFHFASNKNNEALAFFEQCGRVVGSLGNHPLVKEFHYFKGMAHLRAGQDAEAGEHLSKASDLAEAFKDWNKLASTLEQRADLASKTGDSDSAKTHLTRAVELATQHDALKEMRKGLRRKLEALS